MSFERYSEMRRDNPPFVVQIGAHDGKFQDPLYHYFKAEGWYGLLVEPLADIFSKLQETYADCTDRLSFAQVAIVDPAFVDQTGYTVMIRPDSNLIQTGKLPEWAKGIATVLNNNITHYTAIGQLLQNSNGQIVTERVPAITFDGLLLKYDIRAVDIVQIDVEGNDSVVLRQFPFDRYQPDIINLEILGLPPEERKATQELVTTKGYVFITHGLDLLAIHETILSKMIRFEEKELYQNYVERGLIIDGDKLPCVIAMLGEAVGQIMGFFVNDSSKSVKGHFQDGYEEVLEKRQEPNSDLAMISLASMKPYFSDKQALVSFLKEELPNIAKKEALWQKIVNMGVGGGEM
ncbi:MAG TPA: FkbM family methyltransferase [Ktedonobacteraceae bacterium]|jgi:FkbM family methyltransferase